LLSNYLPDFFFLNADQVTGQTILVCRLNCYFTRRVYDATHHLPNQSLYLIPLLHAYSSAVPADEDLLPLTPAVKRRFMCICRSLLAADEIFADAEP
jgi:hypothetical protein